MACVRLSIHASFIDVHQHNPQGERASQSCRRRRRCGVLLLLRSPRKGTCVRVGKASHSLIAIPHLVCLACAWREFSTRLPSIHPYSGASTGVHSSRNRVVVSGFGPFKGISDNPSQRLVEALQQEQEQEGQGQGQGPSPVVCCRVIEVRHGAMRWYQH